MTRFKVGDKVEYRGGAWEGTSFPLKIGGIYTVAYVHSRTIRLIENLVSRQPEWNYFDASRYFSKAVVSLPKNIKIL